MVIEYSLPCISFISSYICTNKTFSFFLYFVKSDRHIFPQKRTRGRKDWDYYCNLFSNLNVLDIKKWKLQWKEMAKDKGLYSQSLRGLCLASSLWWLLFQVFHPAFRCYHNSESLWDRVRLCTSTTVTAW